MRRSEALDRITDVPRSCSHCGKLFKPKRDVARSWLKNPAQTNFYCSQKCSANARREIATERRKKTEVSALMQLRSCPGCNKQFTPTRKNMSAHVRKGAKIGLYCSIDCSGHTNSLKSAEAATGVPLSDWRGKIEQNFRSCFYCVRSPDRKYYTFRNMNHFVRTHPELFPPGYAVEKPEPTRPGSIHTRGPMAASGLRSLFAKRAPASWLGWVGVWKKDRLGKVVWERPVENETHITDGAPEAP